MQVLSPQKVIIIIIMTGLTSMAARAEDLTASYPALLNDDWSGFYAGINSGYALKDMTLGITPNDPNAQNGTCGNLYGGTCASNPSTEFDGVLGGLQMGYNWRSELLQNWIIGAETDFDWSHISSKATSNFILGTPAPSNIQDHSNLESFGTVRGRLGTTFWDNFLLYGTGGFAYGEFKNTGVLNSQPGADLTSLGSGISFGYYCPSGSNCFLGKSTKFLSGWAAGLGGEYKLSSDIGIKLEYLHVDLGTMSTDIIAQNKAGSENPSSFSAKSDVNFDTIRIGLNYYF